MTQDHTVPQDAAQDAQNWDWARPDAEPLQDWEWAREPEEPAQSSITPADVALILVVKDADEWLARTLVAIARLTERPAVVIAVDQGSTDGSRALLEKACDELILDEVIDGSAQASFGEAVAQAVALLPRDHVWLWLLHDDVEPRRDALHQLLLRADQDDHPDLLYPALLEPRRRNYADRVAELGQSISGTGHRVLSVDPGDVDQHQLDSAAVLGGSTAGLLITRVAFDQLEGFAPELPAHRDGVDLGWRAHDAGLGVVTAPRAGLHHLQAGRFGIRELPGQPDPAALDAQLGMRLAAARSARPALTRWGLVFWSWLRGLGLLIGKAPREALAEFRAGRALIGDGDQIRALAARTPAQPADVAALRPARFSGLGRGLDRLAGSFTDRYRDLRDDRKDLSIDELTGDEFAGGWTRTRWMAPTTFIFTALALVALISARTLTNSGSLVGPRLLPSPDTVGAAFRAWLRSPDSLPGANAPWLGLTALGSALLTPEGFVRTLVLASPLVAALSCFGLVRWAWGRMARTVPAALISALYGLGLVLFGASGRGSLGALVVAIIAPRLVLAVLRWFTKDTPEALTSGAERWRAPASIAIWLTLAGAFVPLFWALGLVIAVAHPLVNRVFSARPVLVALAPILVAAPWWQRLWHEPLRLLTSADPLASPLTPPPTGVIALVAGGTGLGAWLSLGLVALVWLGGLTAVVLALRAGDTMPLVLFGAALALLGVALGLPKFSGVLDGIATRPDGDPWYLLSWLALTAALVVALGRGGDPHPRKGAHLAFSAVLWVLVLAASTVWISGVRTNQLAVTSSQLPAYVQAVQQSDRATRTLMIQINEDTVRWSLVAADRPQWGTAEQNPAGDADAAAALRAIVRQIEAGSISDSLAQDLSVRGIGHLWLQNGSQVQVSAISNAPGLSGGFADEHSRVWTVQSAPSHSPAPTSSSWGWAIGQLVGFLALVVVAAPSVGRGPRSGPRRAQGGA